MNERKYNIVKKLMTCFLVIILLCSLAQLLIVTVLDRTPIVTKSLNASDEVFIVSDGLTESTDSWGTVIAQSEDPEDLAEYTGATFQTAVYNNNSFRIKDWTLRMDVTKEFYLNGFWCGEFEVHQFRDGQEIVEVVNMNTYDLSTMKLDHNIFAKELFITLKPGDYLVYYPSAEANELVINPNGMVGFGYIAYFQDSVDFSHCELTYYNDLKLTDGVLFKIIIVMLALWAIATVIHMVSVATYRRASAEIESVTISVINGLSREYQTLWLIDIKEKTIKLIRNRDYTDINKAIDIAKDFEDYNYAIKFYIDNYIDDNDRDRVWSEVNFDMMIEHLSQEEFFTVTFLHHPSDDDCRYMQMVFTKAIDDGENQKAVLAYRDVDRNVRADQMKQKQLADALEDAKKANNSKTIFLASMSHEIRTPINAILGMDTMILRESNEEPIMEYAKDIKTAGVTLLSIVNDILDFSKIESGKMEIVNSEYRLDSVINDLVNMIKPRADEKGLSFSLNLNPDAPVNLIGDEIRVKQIILNLLSNAVKYTNNGGFEWNVDFEKTTPGECILKVSVKDTGMGIREEDLDVICSPYLRLEKITNRSIEGTGLGLSITSNLLEKMDSKLEIESTYGVGSTFSFALLQKTYGDEKIGAHLGKEPNESEAEEKYHAPDADILVVDDVEMNIVVIRNLLKRVEIVPDTCLSGKEAVRLANEKKYDLILMDAMMPGMSGEETLNVIRKESSINADTPIVVLTANAVLGARESYIEKGFADYLSKPIDSIELEDMIQRYLPVDKIEVVSAPDRVKKVLSDHDKNLIEKIASINGIKTDEGIIAAGDETTYLHVCKVFCDSSKERLSLIKKYAEEDDLNNYTIQVHALKSSARLIGASDLAELALEMELAGKDNNKQLIDKSTGKLLTIFMEINDSLSAVMEKERDTQSAGERKQVSDDKLRRMLRDLMELAQALDGESAKQLMSSLEEYDVPESFDSTYVRLKELMAEFNYDAIVAVIAEYLG